MKLLENFLDLNEKHKSNILVVGDTMLDNYFQVDVKRISPEFPIPVMKSSAAYPSMICCGGAANVAYQFKHLNSNVKLVGLLNNDAKKIYKENGINTDLCYTNETIKVPVKQRFYQDDFPLCRWDLEEDNYGFGEVIDWLVLSLKNNIDKYKIENPGAPRTAIFSDYNKGTFRYRESKKLLMEGEFFKIVDPKEGDVKEWMGCDVLKPNSIEAEKLSGFRHYKDQIEFFKDNIGCKYIVITHGGEGISGWDGGDFFKYNRKDILKKEIICRSVIGAGDTYSCFLSHTLDIGIPFQEAALIAFYAGACYVQNIHNKPVSVEDLVNLLDPIKAKYFLPPPRKERNFTLAFANGCYDLPHFGHIRSLQEAKQHGDKLIVGINSDESIKKLKGENRPIIPLKQRMEIISSMECVDYVISFDEGTPENLINKIDPDCVVKGGDYNASDIVSGKCENVVVTPLVEGISTSKIIEKINAL